MLFYAAGDEQAAMESLAGEYIRSKFLPVAERMYEADYEFGEAFIDAFPEWDRPRAHAA